MAVDYTFIISFNSTSLGNKSVSFNASPGGRSSDQTVIYGWRFGSNEIYQYTFSTNTLTSLGTNASISGSITGLFCDDVNGHFYISTQTSPTTYYKVSLSSPTSTPLATYTAPSGSGFGGITGFSATSGTLLLSTRQLLNTSNLTLITTVAGAGGGVMYLPNTNEYITQDSLNTINFINASTGATITSRSIGVTGRSIRGGVYAADVDRIYFFLSANGEIAVHSPSTGYISVHTTSAPSSVSPILYYFSRIKVLAWINPTPGTQTYYLFNTSNNFSLISSPSIINSQRAFGRTIETEQPLLIYLTSNTFFTRLNFNRFDTNLVAVSTANVPAFLSESTTSDAVYFPANNVAEIRASLNFFSLDSWMSLVSSANTEIEYNWTRSENTQASTTSTLGFFSTTSISGDFTITIASGGTLILGTRTEYTENFIFQSGSTIEVRNDVTLTGFTLAAGVAINRASGVTDPITVTVLSDPGVVPGTGVTIAAPQELFVRAVTGLPVGAKVFLARRSAPGFALLSEFTLASGNNSGNNTLVITESIPDDKPDEGYVRVFDNAGNEDRYQYVSWTGSTFTLSGTLSKTYASGNSCYVPYLDTTAGSGTVSVDLLYVADRDVVLVVRLGSGTGAIEEIVQNYTLTNQDSSIPVSGVLDPINTQ